MDHPRYLERVDDLVPMHPERRHRVYSSRDFQVFRALLILTDLAFNFDAHAPFLTRLVIGLVGKIGTLSPTLVERLATRDKAALTQSMERLLAMPFERVIVTHGDVVEQGGREQLIDSYKWALGR